MRDNIYSRLIATFALFVIFAFRFRFYVGLAVAIAAWLLIKMHGPVEPMDAGQLLIYVSQLSETMIAALISSAVTTIGFFLIFAANRASLRETKATEIRLHAAAEIRAFFNEASQCLIQLKIYAKNLKKLYVAIHSPTPQNQLHAQTAYMIDSADKYLAFRERLLVLLAECHSLPAKHSAMLASMPGAAKQLSRSIEILEGFGSPVWFMTPNPGERTISAILRIGACPQDEWDPLILKYEESFDELSFAYGSVCGWLEGQGIFLPKLGSLSTIWARE